MTVLLSVKKIFGRLWGVTGRYSNFLNTSLSSLYYSKYTLSPLEQSRWRVIRRRRLLFHRRKRSWLPLRATSLRSVSVRSFAVIGCSETTTIERWFQLGKIKQNRTKSGHVNMAVVKQEFDFSINTNKRTTGKNHKSNTRIFVP